MDSPILPPVAEGEIWFRILEEKVENGIRTVTKAEVMSCALVLDGDGKLKRPENIAAKREP